MANITRWDPFEDMFKDFGGFFLRPVGALGEVTENGTIRVDVKEDAETYRVHAELPGVKKEDISVDIDGPTVAISAEKKHSNEVREGERVLRTERYYGRVSRSFKLATDVDQAQATAKFADGVLELTLPKKAGERVRKIAVE
ncbi:MAG: Hsp20/alpha crystallin family protein [Rhodocyclaceae bacterium]|nr:Hsp20/alpha crystallin family protein [Rhodocyclaceae bacterium]MBX3670327.1 Hsp20/alpha crystallin family protein [Rhodocyclaceae bacterium]